MTKEDLIRNLRYTEKKHKNDRVDTFGTNISTMCADILKVLDRCIEIPEGATNGDMIKVLFPSASETDHFILNSPIGNIIYIRLEEYQEMRVQEEWWNSPYRKEQE